MTRYRMKFNPDLKEGFFSKANEQLSMFDKQVPLYTEPIIDMR